MKDRLIQTRVPERLESVLKEEAKKRRLTVSHLIRNMLEDTLDLVDTVVAGAGDLVGTSVDIAEQVAQGAGKIASTAREAVRVRSEAADEKAQQEAGAAAPGAPAEAPREAREKAAPPSRSLDHVLAWNQVVVNRAATCARCDRELPKGGTAHLGLSQDPSAPPAWLCSSCLEQL